MSTKLISARVDRGLRLFLWSVSAAAFVWLLCGLKIAAAQTTEEILAPVQTNSLSGKVVDREGEGLDRVKVERITGPSKEVVDSVVADDKGKFELKAVPDGEYVIRLTRPGFRTSIRHIVVKKAYDKNLSLVMSIGF
jgi:hypothetical protein